MDKKSNNLRRIIKWVWTTPILTTGIFANMLVVTSTASFFRMPYGSSVYYDDWIFFVLLVSALSLLIGFLLFGRAVRQRNGKTTVLENIGLLLHLTPWFLAFSLLNITLKLKGLWNDT